MNPPSRRRASLAAAVVAAALGAAIAPTASAKTVWVCHPDKKSDPCDGSLTAQRVGGDGRLGLIERTRRARRPAVDCFYVYPTVSDQPPPNADRTADGPVRAIARFQAARFSQHCRVFAPVYRQLTLGAIGSTSITNAQRALAYGDVRDAWRD